MPQPTSQNIDNRGFSLKNVFQLPLVPTPIRNMQNMFSFSKINQKKFSPYKPNLTKSKKVWNNVGNKPGVKDGQIIKMIPNRLPKEPKKNKITDLRWHNKMESPLTVPFSTQNLNNIRQSDLALFGGHADYGWKKVVNTKTNFENVVQNTQDNKKRKRQEHLNAIINSYKNNSFHYTPSKNEKLVKDFSTNTKYEYHKFRADDVTRKNKNYANRKQSNRQYDNMRLQIPLEG